MDASSSPLSLAITTTLSHNSFSWSAFLCLFSKIHGYVYRHCPFPSSCLEYHQPLRHRPRPKADRLRWRHAYSCWMQRCSLTFKVQPPATLKSKKLSQPSTPQPTRRCARDLSL